MSNVEANEYINQWVSFPSRYEVFVGIPYNIRITGKHISKHFIITDQGDTVYQIMSRRKERSSLTVSDEAPGFFKRLLQRVSIEQSIILGFSQTVSGNTKKTSLVQKCSNHDTYLHSLQIVFISHIEHFLIYFGTVIGPFLKPVETFFNFV